jgi:hypothetical protein
MTEERRQAGLQHKFWRFIDSRAIVRRSVLAFTLFLTYQSVFWAYEFGTVAISMKADLLGVAAIIGAIMLPITGLQGFVFNSYTRGRQD